MVPKHVYKKSKKKNKKNKKKRQKQNQIAMLNEDAADNRAATPPPILLQDVEKIEGSRHHSRTGTFGGAKLPSGFLNAPGTENLPETHRVWLHQKQIEVFLSVFICMCICVCICVCLCVYLYLWESKKYKTTYTTHTHTHTHTHTNFFCLFVCLFVLCTHGYFCRICVVFVSCCLWLDVALPCASYRFRMIAVEIYQIYPAVIFIEKKKNKYSKTKQFAIDQKRRRSSLPGNWLGGRAKRYTRNDPNSNVLCFYFSCFLFVLCFLFYVLCMHYKAFIDGKK